MYNESEVADMDVLVNEGSGIEIINPGEESSSNGGLVVLGVLAVAALTTGAYMHLKKLKQVKKAIDESDAFDDVKQDEEVEVKSED